MSHPSVDLDTTEHTTSRPQKTQPAPYTSGCPELDDRVLSGRRSHGLSGGLVGLSGEGDIGLVVSLQVAVQHLHQDDTATARLITTLPVAHVVRLLKGVLKGTRQATTEDPPADGEPETTKLSSSTRASILGRVLISRIYGHDDLQAVLNELEQGVPFQRLWSTGSSQREDELLAKKAQKTEGDNTANTTPSTPSKIIILTEMDHHFKWMRLQNNGGRLYELYGQLMRRLRALAATGTASATASLPLVFVLNNTITRRPKEGTAGVAAAAAAAEDGPPGTADGGHRSTPSLAIDQDTTYRLALAALQRGNHVGRLDIFRLCCDELAKAQCIEPRYKTLLDYYCGLHVCFTRLPVDLVDMWGGKEGGSMSLADSSLWVTSVETDEAEISHRVADRVGVVHLSRGIVQDASCS